MVGPASSPAIRIRKGESIIALAWSNTATQILGTFRVLYDNGKEDDFKLFQTLLTNNRLINLLSAQQTASDDGWILSGQMQQQGGVANQATQRGQLYVKACVVSGIDGPTNMPSATIPQCKAMICSGYLYTGVEVSVGQLIEPGPAGGPGNIRTAPTTDPAAGLETPDFTLPTGVIWLIRSYTVQLVQGLTQTPLPSLEFEDASNNQLAVIPAMTVALGVSTTAQLTWALGLVQTSFTAVAGDEIYTAPLPYMYLTATNGAAIATLTDGIGANTNYGAALITLEEWVMPN